MQRQQPSATSDIACISEGEYFASSTSRPSRFALTQIDCPRRTVRRIVRRHININTQDGRTWNCDRYSMEEFEKYNELIAHRLERVSRTIKVMDGVDIITFGYPLKDDTCRGRLDTT